MVQCGLPVRYGFSCGRAVWAGMDLAVPCQGLDSVGHWQRTREAACMGSRKVRARFVGHWQQDVTSDAIGVRCPVSDSKT